MKSGVSSLNPYAASYIPLSKREAYDRNEPATKDSKSVNEAAWYVQPLQVAQNLHVAQNQHHNKVSLDSVAHGAEKIPISEGSMVQSHPVRGSWSSKLTMDEEFDIDLEYLQMSFPGLSYQSLTDVYLANKGDLDATIDMLTQLEVHYNQEKIPAHGELNKFDTESPENLPDSLDIGDVSESRSPAECAALKLKNVVGEAGASSSCSSGSAVVS